MYLYARIHFDYFINWWEVGGAERKYRELKRVFLFSVKIAFHKGTISKIRWMHCKIRILYGICFLSSYGWDLRHNILRTQIYKVIVAQMSNLVPLASYCNWYYLWEEKCGCILQPFNLNFNILKLDCIFGYFLPSPKYARLS